MLERTDAITNVVLEPITFVIAYPHCIQSSVADCYFTALHLLCKHTTSAQILSKTCRIRPHNLVPLPYLHNTFQAQRPGTSLKYFRTTYHVPSCKDSLAFVIEPQANGT